MSFLAKGVTFSKQHAILHVQKQKIIYIFGKKTKNGHEQKNAFINAEIFRTLKHKLF